MQVRYFFLDHSETLDISHAFLPLVVAKLSTLKQVRFCWTTLYNVSLKVYDNLFNCLIIKRVLETQ